MTGDLKAETEAALKDFMERYPTTLEYLARGPEFYEKKIAERGGIDKMLGDSLKHNALLSRLAKTGK